eukprot:Partr_v1_DN25910_c2_g1_i3_m68449 putative Glutamyl-tRNA synthetase
MAAQNIRVRFAPSPTGLLHLGGLKTALINYLFAKRNSGKMILRIEDTDRSRYSPGSVDSMVQTLKELGMKFDEGPGEVGGTYGPYTQSSRSHLYKKSATQLLENGAAYRCFCDSQRLLDLRSRARIEAKPPKYDGHCRELTENQVKDKMGRGLPFTVRLRVPNGIEIITFNDLIHKKMLFQSKLLDDAILMKSDGMPTYHLANVVDDHYMQISHVIRGQEWLTSTPKHLAIYKALGWEAPQFAHVPLLFNSDGSKISKRHGHESVADLLKSGYFPEVILNYVAAAGWSTPNNTYRIYGIDQLAKSFSLQSVHRPGSAVDRVKLDELNRSRIATKWKSESGRTEIMQHLRKFAPNQRDETISTVFELLMDKLTCISDFQRLSRIYFDRPSLVYPFESMSREDVKAVVNEVAALDTQTPKELIEEFEKAARSVGPNVQPKILLRFLLTGMKNGPPLIAIVNALGVRECLARIQTS